MVACRYDLMDFALQRAEAVVQQWHTRSAWPPTDAREPFAVIDVATGEHLGHAALACGEHTDTELPSGDEVLNGACRLAE
jgi:hypothetical protein